VDHHHHATVNDVPDAESSATANEGNATVNEGTEPPLQQRNPTTTFEQIGAASNPCTRATIAASGTSTTSPPCLEQPCRREKRKSVIVKKGAGKKKRKGARVVGALIKPYGLGD